MMSCPALGPDSRINTRQACSVTKLARGPHMKTKAPRWTAFPPRFVLVTTRFLKSKSQKWEESDEISSLCSVESHPRRRLPLNDLGRWLTTNPSLCLDEAGTFHSPAAGTHPKRTRQAFIVQRDRTKPGVYFISFAEQYLRACT